MRLKIKFDAPQDDLLQVESRKEKTTSRSFANEAPQCSL